MANNPAARTVPEKMVKITLPNVTLARKFQNGAIKPNTNVMIATSPDEKYNAIRDENPYRIQTSSSVPNAVVPTYPALDMNNDEIPEDDDHTAPLVSGETVRLETGLPVTKAANA
mgnify:CR=1 FL=1